MFKEVKKPNLQQMENLAKDVPSDDNKADLTSNLESLENEYWGNRLRYFLKAHGEEGNSVCCDALKNDAAAWSIFAALLMTVGFANLATSEGDYKEEIDEDTKNICSLLWVGFNALSAALSFVAVVVGTFRFVYFNNIPPKLIDKAIANCKQMQTMPFVIASMAFQLAAGVVGVYLFFGLNAMYVSLGVMVIALIIICYVFYLQTSSTSWINNTVFA